MSLSPVPTEGPGVLFRPVSGRTKRRSCLWPSLRRQQCWQMPEVRRSAKKKTHTTQTIRRVASASSSLWDRCSSCSPPRAHGYGPIGVLHSDLACVNPTTKRKGRRYEPAQKKKRPWQDLARRRREGNASPLGPRCRSSSSETKQQRADAHSLAYRTSFISYISQKGSRFALPQFRNRIHLHTIRQGHSAANMLRRWSLHWQCNTCWTSAASPAFCDSVVVKLQHLNWDLQISQRRKKLADASGGQPCAKNAHWTISHLEPSLCAHASP